VKTERMNLSKQIWIVLPALLLAACAHHRPAAKPVAAKISGTVTYLQKMALSPDATVEVEFSDVSKSDAAPIQLGHQVIRAAGKQVPIPFSIAYDARQIVSDHIYEVTARIKQGEQVLFASGAPVLVLTQGRPTNVEIVVTPKR
jgi:putative lipoprotein